MTLFAKNKYVVGFVVSGNRPKDKAIKDDTTPDLATTLGHEFSQSLLNGSESGFKRAFATLFGQDLETFTGTMFLNMDQLEKQLDNEEFQEIGSMASFKMQTTEGKVDTCKALDASLVDIESSGTKSKEQDTSSRSWNDAHANDADIRPVYDEEPMAEVQTTTKINVFATRQQHTEITEF
ncbi:hypothetical protein Tco_0624332 [Tanacetum coccineum]|uniref:Uncharacterized protein n=1 Tax=Tanacetum coccineum TaxID=301880 RepID=A0ABQ4WDK4_9ASTR